MKKPSNITEEPEEKTYMCDDMFAAMGWTRVPKSKETKKSKELPEIMSDEDVMEFLFGKNKGDESTESAMEVDSKKCYEKHILTTKLNGKTHKIKAKVSPDRITLTPPDGGYDTFKFDRSTPDTIKAMAHLMIASCDLLD